MNVWIIQTGEPLPLWDGVKKMRSAILADKLVERGHTVTWWASAFDHFRKEWVCNEEREIAIKDRLKIIALKGSGYRKNVSFARFMDHRRVARKFSRQAPLKKRPDIMVVSMPPHDLAYRAVKFGKDNHIPVVVDIRDPWPDIFLEHVKPGVRGLLRLLLHRDFQMVKNTLLMADSLVAVIHSFLEWGLKYAGRGRMSTDRIFYLGFNRHDRSINPKVSEKYARLREVIKDKFVVFFVGSISRSYHNPSILLQAAEKLKNNKGIHFVIAGDGELYEQLKSGSRQMENVSMTGWLNKEEIDYFLSCSSIGICPVTMDVNLPTNKAFCYFSAGLPVVSAFQGELKEIIEKYQMGIYYPPNNTDALVESIKKLYDNPALYKIMSDNTRRIFEEMFDADKIYDAYADHLEQIAYDYKSQGSNAATARY